MYMLAVKNVLYISCTHSVLLYSATSHQNLCFLVYFVYFGMFRRSIVVANILR